MSNEEIRELTLRRLLEDNFMCSRYCRKSMEILKDISLKDYFKNLASRRSQFATELHEEFRFYTGREPYIPSQPYDRTRKDVELKDRFTLIKKTLKLAKNSLKKYQEALCRIHEGSCREILLRHKAFIENSIFELKSIKTLIKFQNQENGQIKQEGSHI